MLLNETVKTTWNGNNKSHFVSKGYKFTKLHDDLIVKVKDLQDSSNILLEFKCDYCGENYFRSYYKYSRGKQGGNEKDCCDKCIKHKRKETIIKKYGVDSYAKTEEFKDNNKKYCLNKYGVENFFQTEMIKKMKLEIHKIPYTKIKQFIEIDSYSGCILITTPEEYIDTKHIIKIKCKCENTFETIFNTFKSENKRQCDECTKLLRSGENHHNWNGGISNLSNYLRFYISDWKIKSIKECDYKCKITGNRFQAVHHLYAFNLILEELLKELKIPLFSTIAEYNSNQLDGIKEKVIELHNKYPLGICLCNEIHKLFHSLYGSGYNTPEQFDGFKIRLKNGEFNTYLKENNINLII